MLLGTPDSALYDKTITRASGGGLLFNQVFRCMSHALLAVFTRVLPVTDIGVPNPHRHHDHTIE